MTRHLAVTSGTVIYRKVTEKGKNSTAWPALYRERRFKKRGTLPGLTLGLEVLKPYSGGVLPHCSFSF